MPYRSLSGDRIAQTIDLLCRRAEMRFPGSGLSNVCRELATIAARTTATAEWIRRPILSLRIAVGGLLALIALGMLGALQALRLPRAPLQLPDFVQALEAGINDLVLVGAAIYFLLTLESRLKRRRALKAIHELRAIAHVIDMHQLTKDPEWVLDRGRETGVLPSRRLDAFALSRYLDYCSEALSLAGKVAALYIQDFGDPVALQAVNEVEALTTGLSRKIWQKLMILHADRRASAGGGTLQEGAAAAEASEAQSPPRHLSRQGGPDAEGNPLPAERQAGRRRRGR